MNAGITLFLDLTEFGERNGYRILLREEAQEAQMAVPKYLNLPMRDWQVPDIKHMTQVLDTSDEAVARKEKVYIHCYGGIGRTGMVVGCYLVRHGNTGPEALAELNRLFQTTGKSQVTPQSPDTNEQSNFILNWKG